VIGSVDDAGPTAQPDLSRHATQDIDTASIEL